MRSEGSGGVDVLLDRLRPHRGLVLAALVLAAFTQVFSLLDPLIFRHIIDRYAVRPAEYTTEEFFRGVGLLLLATLTVGVLGRASRNLQDYCVNVIAQRVGARLYSDGLRHALSLPYAVLEDQRSGETLGMLHKVRGDSERFVTVFVNVLFPTVVGVVFVIVYAYTVHWAIAPAFLLAGALLGTVSSTFGRRIKRVQQSIVSEGTALAGSTTESLRNVEMVKALGLTRQELARLDTTTDRLVDLELKKARYVRSMSFAQGTAVLLLRIAVILLMVYLAFMRQITVGQFLSLLLYSFFVFGPLHELGGVLAVYREADASLSRYRALLDSPPDPRPHDAIRVGDLQVVEFDEVTFAHGSTRVPAVHGISFRAARGETLAFVGPSGAGKTTLVKLLVGLYRPQAGEVRYDGVASTRADLDELREQIGLVAQDTQLFSGSIRENLLFARPGATDAQCVEALRGAAAQNLLTRGGRGLDTRIGEGGVKISGGERQRLAIARALLRQPRLLVFDEATSSLDSLTEEEIGRTMREISDAADAITIVVAHRLSTVMHADRIFVLERGCIVEAGRHPDLLEERGLYYAMWRQQMGERSGNREGLVGPVAAGA
jgi:ATP-binding cassette, subfamily B, bacterial